MTTMQQTPLPTTAQEQETINLDAWRIINTLVVVRGWRRGDVAARICRGRGAVSGVYNGKLNCSPAMLDDLRALIIHERDN